MGVHRVLIMEQGGDLTVAGTRKACCKKLRHCGGLKEQRVPTEWRIIRTGSHVTMGECHMWGESCLVECHRLGEKGRQVG